MRPNIDRIASELLRDLRRDVDPRRREFMAGYAPTAESILGVAVPSVRQAAKHARSLVVDESLNVRFELATKILALGFLETRLAAYELLQRDASLLSRQRLRILGAGVDNWGTVDAFSVLLAGPAWLAGRLQDADIRRWARSRDPWWRRVAVVSTVVLNTPSRGGTGDSRRTLAICRDVAGDEDKFVQKALSWALRSLSRWNPDGVTQFLEEHARTIPAFVRREVLNKLETGTKGGRVRA